MLDILIIMQPSSPLPNFLQWFHEDGFSIIQLRKRANWLYSGDSLTAHPMNLYYFYGPSYALMPQAASPASLFIGIETIIEAAQLLQTKVQAHRVIGITRLHLMTITFDARSLRTHPPNLYAFLKHNFKFHTILLPCNHATGYCCRISQWLYRKPEDICRGTTSPLFNLKSGTPTFTRVLSLENTPLLG